MSFSSILRYTLGALLFSLAACGLWLAWRLGRRRPWARRDTQMLICVGYLSALIQITGLRLGLVAPSFLGGRLNLVPFRTTLSEWAGGIWPFLYHVLGNMLWFVPLGFLLPRLHKRCRWSHVLLCGALVSLLAEVLQFLMGSGVSDVDDLILNALGALLGWLMHRLFRQNTII
ncbi:MAG: VanZ family protein [Clostridia bacterium]|nr:VanZ family protein [Clostridia bacterium]